MAKKLPGALSTGVWDTTEQGPTWEEQREKSVSFFQTKFPYLEVLKSGWVKSPPYVPLTSPIGGPTVGTAQDIFVERVGQSWSLTSTQVENLKSGGARVLWLGALPTKSDGATTGDLVSVSSTVFVEPGDTDPGPPHPITVTVPGSAAPVATDAAGTEDDRVTLTHVEGIRWRLGPAGAYQYYDKEWFGGQATKQAPWAGGNTVEVSAVPLSGYVLSGTAAWSVKFTNVPGVTNITVGPTQLPTANDGSGTANDVVTLSKVEGVIWVVDGSNHPSSAFTGATKSVPYTKGTSTTVTATADTGYALSGTTSWNLTFTDVAAGGWELVAQFGASELGVDRKLDTSRPTPADDFYRFVMSADGKGRIFAPKGTVDIVGGKMVLSGSVDSTIRLYPINPIGTKFAFEFTVHGRPEEWSRNSAYVTRPDWSAANPYGWTFDGATAIPRQDPNFDFGGESSNTAQTPRIPISTTQTVMRVEVDSVGNPGKFRVFANGVEIGNYNRTGSTSNTPFLQLRRSAYSSSPTTYSDFKLFKGAA